MNDTNETGRLIEKYLPVDYHDTFSVQTDVNGLSPAEIMEDIQRNSSIPMSVKRVNSFGRILKKQEIPSKHVRSGTLYHVVKLVAG